MTVSKVARIPVAIVGLVLSHAAVAVELATPPIWFFQFFATESGVVTCTAMNLHNKAIHLRTRLIVHDEDTLLFPADPYLFEEATERLEPGQATAITVWIRPDSSVGLARCEFKYDGGPKRLKATVILDDQNGSRAIALPAEPVGR